MKRLRAGGCPVAPMTLLQRVMPRYSKMGLVPAMGCPQTCRHCMFTWRPPRGKNEDPDAVYHLVDKYTDSVLFTGGDLTKQLDYFYDAISVMRHVKNFALLLNGDFADTTGGERGVGQDGEGHRKPAEKMGNGQGLVTDQFRRISPGGLR
ncbi:radical SAM protein [Thiohalophilus sp.]|uniref:radical SAM protein n=1 Tax=Thiohalophilus sp. TaxID=3028392 RepID=UPI002ACE50A7|nr:radical SAM protein [Thiohalophilus sp.]MDZ7803237.1 radical SAM protein [Thiohalophilus sp.]